MEQQFQYYAFISYKREDERWAKWLQEKLENYKLPSIIRREIPRLPKRIRPVFRDKTDLGAGLLTQSLRKELELSRYLIVVSSPQSARSEWVGKEIGSFIEMGRADHIIPFIVAGTPDSPQPGEECFHPMLKRKAPELLGINVQEIGKEQAFIKVVAKLLDLRFDTLWNRHRRQQKRQRAVRICAAVLLLACLGLIWDYQRTKHEYYADYVDRWGLPEGIVQLDKKTMQKRFYHYRFEFKNKLNFLGIIRTGGILIQVVCANSYGNPIDCFSTEYANRPVIQEFEYNRNNNELLRIVYKDKYGNALKFLTFPTVSKHTVDIVSKGGVAASTLASTTSLTSSQYTPKHNANKSSIGRYQYERNEKGEITKVMFRQNNDNLPVADANGIYAIAYRLDSLGRPLRIRYLNEQNDTVCDNTGVAGRNYTYDGYGNIARSYYVDARDSLVLNEQGWAVVENQADANGNIVICKFFNEKNRPCLAGAAGTHIQKTTLDAHGRIVQNEFFDTEGNLSGAVRGYAICKMAYEKDRPVEQTFFHPDHTPALSYLGMHKIVGGHKGPFIFTEQYYDVDGQPCYKTEGFSQIELHHSPQMKIIKEIYFDAEGNRCYRKGVKCSEIRQIYEEDNLTNVAYYADDGSPASSGDKGIHRCEMIYDTKGNIVEERYYDKNGALAADKQGIAILKTVRDVNGNMTEQVLCNTLGEPVWLIKQKYEKGRCTEEEFFDGKGNRTIYPSKGFYKQKIAYDAAGRPVKVETFTLKDDGELVLQHVYYKKRDSRGNEIETYLCDADGNLLLNEIGIGRVVCQWNEYNKQTQARFFDLQNRPCVGTDGYAGWNATYDLIGRRTRLTYIGTDGAPCENKEGISRYEDVYDPRGNLLSEKQYDKAGKLVENSQGYAVQKMQYDARGNVIEISCYDSRNQLKVIPAGYARLEKKYNNRNQCIEERYYDQTNRIFNTGENLAVAILGYDDYGNLSEIACYDKDKNRSSRPYGYFKLKKTCDAAGTLYDQTTYDVQDSILSLLVPVCFISDNEALYPKDLRQGGVLFKYGEWEAGEPNIRLNATVVRTKYQPKEIHILNPEGEFATYSLEAGAAGMEIVYMPVDYPTFLELKNGYDQWKASLKPPSDS